MTSKSTYKCRGDSRCFAWWVGCHPPAAHSQADTVHAPPLPSCDYCDPSSGRQHQILTGLIINENKLLHSNNAFYYCFFENFTFIVPKIWAFSKKKKSIEKVKCNYRPFCDIFVVKRIYSFAYNFFITDQTFFKCTSFFSQQNNLESHSIYIKQWILGHSVYRTKEKLRYFWSIL